MGLVLFYFFTDQYTQQDGDQHIWEGISKNEVYMHQIAIENETNDPDDHVQFVIGLVF